MTFCFLLFSILLLFFFTKRFGPVIYLKNVKAFDFHDLFEKGTTSNPWYLATSFCPAQRLCHAWMKTLLQSLLGQPSAG